MASRSFGSPVVAVDGLSKAFRLPHERRHTLKERVLRPRRDAGYETLQALHDVSFEVRQGEFFGIVGRNGSGKSTLLKLLAGIYRADAGKMAMAGRLSTFIELGVGFNPDLAARDNVLLNGLMLGLTPREALRRFDSIIEFAELENFVDLKLKNYSSGMQVRLAFSVMSHVDADVLLIDEVLAVGDAAFQEKCFAVFQRLKDAGKTILFVTHDMAAVKTHCDRAMLLEQGDLRIVGEPEKVGTHYLEINFGRDHAALGRPIDGAGEDLEDEEVYGTREAAILDAWFEDAAGQRAEHLPHGEPVTFRMKVRFSARIEYPIFSVLIENQQGVPLFATASAHQGLDTGVNNPADEGIYTVRLSNNPFTRGRIHATPWITYREGTELIDRRPRMASAVVSALDDPGGVVNMPHEVAYERLSSPRTTEPTAA